MAVAILLSIAAFHRGMAQISAHTAISNHRDALLSLTPSFSSASCLTRGRLRRHQASGLLDRHPLLPPASRKAWKYGW